MGKITGRLSIKEGIFHMEGVEQLGQDDTSDGVDRVDDHFEVCVCNGFAVNELKREHAVDMTLVEGVVFGIVAEMIDIGKVEVLSLCCGEHLIAIRFRKEFAFTVKQFQRVPLAGIVGGSDDDATVSTAHAYGKLCCRCCSQSDVKDIKAHTHQGTANNVLYHLTGDTCITAYDDPV